MVRALVALLVAALVIGAIVFIAGKIINDTFAPTEVSELQIVSPSENE